MKLAPLSLCDTPTTNVTTLCPKSLSTFLHPFASSLPHSACQSPRPRSATTHHTPHPTHHAPCRPSLAVQSTLVYHASHTSNIQRQHPPLIPRRSNSPLRHFAVVFNPVARKEPPSGLDHPPRRRPQPSQLRRVLDAHSAPFSIQTPAILGSSGVIGIPRRALLVNLQRSP